MMTAVPSDSAATIHGYYDKLIALLDRNGAAYRLIDHPPEGQTDLVSALRGHQVAAAAKCIVLIVKLGKKVTRFVLAVVPGDTRVDTGKIRSLLARPMSGLRRPTSPSGSQAALQVLCFPSPSIPT